ncbi:hypothetical protein [Aestuariibaculum marinum]|uniref:Peptidase S24/S26A/S26B/S26C domain-containing protein n=1 Tax=Aestuariibaculum marinum TaxID=2683592 RepID=A0A8J6Q6Q3_9FLAO|nr:hypothetical protein [Aestuariibaculum marinum]MBD0822606.1 hypothetical protein [Aestuariibaculum marinum]
MRSPEEIRKIFKDNNITGYRLSIDLDVTQVGADKFLNGETKKPYKSTIEMYNSYIDNGFKSTVIESINKTNTDFIPEGKVIKDENYPSKQVFVIPVKGRGGLENALFDEIMFKQLETETLTIKEPSSNGSKYFKIEVEGISMDDGSKKSLAEGDWAYCRSISKQYWKSKFHTHKYDIFCFFHNERGIIFKRIKDQDTETGELLLESLHPDKKQFPDFRIKVSECSYICNVIKVLSEF